ncbi:MAG: acyl-ACP--UDP-N-acetylglucosamine O-acyltransferase [Spirochaetes bacterium]|nr:acyl-ACP--UDP-N-acetylglucosamine O-acyltransferase [Spirochaetota bacterium]
MVHIHPTAIVDKNAVIEDGVEIGPFAIIEGNVKIGRNTKIYQSVYITGYTDIGENCIIHPFCCIGHIPQDFAFNRSCVSYVKVGDNCEFREGVTIHRGTVAQSETIIKNNVYLMAYAHIAHNCFIDEGVVIANSTLLAGYTKIFKKAFLSGNISVHQHVHIGQYAMISASSFLTKDVPPFCIAQKVPAVVSGLNIVGLRRGGYSQEKRTEITRLFKKIYRSNYNTSQAVSKLSAIDSEEARIFVEFIKDSKRGLTRYRDIK